MNLFTDNVTHYRPGAFEPAPSAASAARDEAIDRCDKHADPEWKIAAYAAVLAVAKAMPDFTADDVWDYLGGTDGTHEPAAMGPVFLRASKAGLIEKTGAMRATREARRHRDLTVWRKVVGR